MEGVRTEGVLTNPGTEGVLTNSVTVGVLMEGVRGNPVTTEGVRAGGEAPAGWVEQRFGPEARQPLTLTPTLTPTLTLTLTLTP